MGYDPSSVTIVLEPKTVLYYGCVACQCHHREGDDLFDRHLGHQDKHGTKVLVLQDHYARSRFVRIEPPRYRNPFYRGW